MDTFKYVYYSISLIFCGNPLAIANWLTSMKILEANHPGEKATEVTVSQEIRQIIFKSCVRTSNKSKNISYLKWGVKFQDKCIRLVGVSEKFL